MIHEFFFTIKYGFSVEKRMIDIFSSTGELATKSYLIDISFSAL
jgi:hypothetical protein